MSNLFSNQKPDPPLISFFRGLAMCLFTWMNYVGSFKADPEKAFGVNESILKDWTFLSVIAIVACFVFVFVFVNKSERQQMIARMKSLKILFFFSLYLIVSTVLFPSELGVEKAKRFIIFNLFACLLFVGLTRKPKDLVVFLGFIVVFGLVMSSISFLFQARHPFHFLATGDNYSRSWTYIQYGALATSAGTILIIWSVEAFSNIALKIASVGGVLLCLLGVIYSGERGSILFVPFIFVCYLFSSRRIFQFVSWKFLWIGLAVVAVIFGTAKFMQTEMGQVFLARLDKLGIFNDQSSEVDIRLNSESDYFKPFLENLSKNPLLGSGLGNYFGVDEKGYPHNMFLEIGGELGFSGLVFYFLILFFAFQGYRAMKRRCPPGISYAYLAVFLLFFFRTFKTGDIVGSRYFWLLISTLICFSAMSNTLKVARQQKGSLSISPPTIEGEI